MREEFTSFPSHGEVLHGIIGMPSHSPDIAVILVHGWSGCRMGPHRILVETSRHLNGRGIATLRFDLSGRGESGGDPFATDLDRMVDDTRAAVAEFSSYLPAHVPIALWGMCSGGNVALATLSLEPHLPAAVCWSTYPFQSQRRRRQDVRRAGHFLGRYLRKAFRRETWSKLSRGGVNFRMVVKVLFGHFRRRDGSSRNPRQSARDAEIVEELGRYRGRLFFLFGGADPEAADARDMFQEFFREHGVRADFEEIPGANHNFYSLRWKRMAIQRSAEWLVEALRTTTGEQGAT